jgi:hypothetical protein
MIGNTGVIDGPLDDPDVKARALATLRDCGYLDVVEGSPVNELEDATGAVSLLMERQ